MTEREQIQHFATEIDKVVKRFCEEYDLSVASIAGALQVKAHQVIAEACKEGEEA